MDNTYLQKINSHASSNLGDGVDVTHLVEGNDLDIYLAVSSDDKKGTLYVTDKRLNHIFTVNCPYMMRAMIKMAGVGDYDISADYIETNVTLTHPSSGLDMKGGYVVTDTTETQNPDLYYKIQAAIEEGHAKCTYDKPVLNLLGLKYVGEVMHRF